MKELSYIIKDENGIHARPAGLLVKKAGIFKSSVNSRTPSNSVSEPKTVKFLFPFSTHLHRTDFR